MQETWHAGYLTCDPEGVENHRLRTAAPRQSPCCSPMMHIYISYLCRLSQCLGHNCHPSCEVDGRDITQTQ